MPPTAALTLSLTGKFARQGQDAAARAYAEMASDPDIDLLLGPYSGVLVRAAAPVAWEVGRVLWNHGASGDDLHQPGVATLLAPASTYFHALVDTAVAQGVERVILVQGRGPFARSVAEGARSHAEHQGPRVTVTDADTLTVEDTAEAAVLVVGNFDHDMAVVARLRREHQPALVGAVAAGIPVFVDELGAQVAEGVVGPVQWWPTAHEPGVGPSGIAFAEEFRGRTGREPSYVAAQAAAGGYLAEAAWHQGRGETDLVGWRTSTLLGAFALDDQWRQVGHRMTTIRWRAGRMDPVA